jgi:hypothetical protein
MADQLNDKMTELRQWIVEHGVDVRNLRMEAKEQGTKDTGDYLHWLERKVIELREEAADRFSEAVRHFDAIIMDAPRRHGIGTACSAGVVEPGTPVVWNADGSISPLNDGNEETQP